MRLKKLLDSLDVAKIEGNTEIDISDIVYDSRKVKPASLFVCIKGLKTDGHLFAKEAVLKGAKVLVVEKWLDTPGRIVQIQVPSSRKALAVLSNAFFDYPSSKLKLIGVTGTNGKTTTTYLIQNMLELAKKGAGLIGTVEYRIGKETLKPEMTTPESYDLLKLLRKMVDEKIEFAVMEVSSHAIDLERVNGLNFDTLVFTNLSQDHLDYHGSLSEYFAVKSHLFKENLSSSWIINIDDSYGEKIAKEVLDSGKLLTYGLKDLADVRAEDVKLTGESSKFKVITPDATFKAASPLRGLFNIYNLLATASVGLNLNLSLEVIKSALKKAPIVSGRFELIDAGQDFMVVVDYAHTPDSLKKVLEAARAIAKGKVITIFGCGGDRDRAKRPLMGEAAGLLSDYTIITSDNPRSEEPESIILQIEEGIKRVASRKSYEVIVKRSEAILKGISMAKKDDVVIIAGKGHETGQIFADKTVPFVDQEVAKKALEEVVKCFS